MPFVTINRVVTSFLGSTPRSIVVAGSPFFTTARNYTGGGTITYTEIVHPDGPRASITPDMASATKVVDVAWGRRREFELTMLGTTTYGTNTAVGSAILSRTLPQYHSAEYSHLFCTGADLIDAFGGPRYLNTTVTSTSQDCGDAVFETARYRLTFNRLKYEVLTDAYTQNAEDKELVRWVEREIHHAADNVPIPSGSFKWVTAPSDAIQEGGVPKVFPTRELRYVWNDIPEQVMPIVRERIRRTIGKVNLGPFDFFQGSRIGRGYPAQTLLLIGAEEEPTLRDDGYPFLLTGKLYRVRFTMLYRNNGLLSGTVATGTYAGWNHLYRGPSYSPQFQLATSDGTSGGQRIYETAQYLYLFDVTNVDYSTGGLLV